MKKNIVSGAICLAIALAVAVYTGIEFKQMWKVPEITKGPGVTEIKMLSEYFEGLKGTAADTPIYIMRGEETGGKVLILGGTHPNEPSSNLSTIVFIQNVKSKKGTIFIVPYTNRSGFTHNDAQEASPRDMHFTTRDGEEVVYRFGSRASNPIHQWPDPDVYIHASSGQRLSGSETRNINRAYPGRADGTLTEKAAYGIVQLIQKEGIDLTFDLHEASPEYPVINATVSHEKGMDIGAVGVMNLQLQGIDMTLEPSPVNLHGLTHRELGDFTETVPLLMETANASQGRIRGATNETLALTGKDKFYVKSAKMGLLYVPYDEAGHPIEERVGRHLQGIIEYTKAFGTMYENKKIEFENCPTYEKIYKSAPEAELGGKWLGKFMIK
ncbi:succinylglutamate desuccinylase [Treponema phagedenis]|uniref:Succinylglutamate desuccinylase/aspartoacylase family protein n=1 Tax=Treponema phagedenis TaxID=162 RepID=A0A0B7GS87_TREPH|nr:succinylglutamate desuccinylase/aspartoacylase family protein [Treponema phagedenis]QSH99769.1 succinylglutamate desuccinylase [Treponema phagedenis]CEM60372.1 Succinylglutamate desuccinylase/aspartoacylase family protein [Treponema phagedenis]